MDFSRESDAWHDQGRQFGHTVENVETKLNSTVHVRLVRFFSEGHTAIRRRRVSGSLF